MKKRYLESQNVEMENSPKSGASAIMKLLMASNNKDSKDNETSVFKVSGSANAV